MLQAPSEAEAQCAQMCKEGLVRPDFRSAPSAQNRHAGDIVRMHVPQVYGTASEDMDSLTFATPKLIRNLMKPATQTVPINEYDYDKAGLLCAACIPCNVIHFSCSTGQRLFSPGSLCRCWRA